MIFKFWSKESGFPSIWMRWLFALVVAGCLVAFAINTNAEFSLTGRPAFDLLFLAGAGNFLWYCFVRTLPGWSFRRQIWWILPVVLLQVLGLFCFRMDGLYGNGRPTFVWRWSLDSADRQFSDRHMVEFQYHPSADDPWPGFRGRDRAGSIHGVRVAGFADHEPKLVWEREVGSGWSSFAISDTVCITQEQRGESETVVCYELATGKQLWEYADSVRFDDPTSGTGPRAIPTIDQELVFSFGATGILNCLDVRSGELIWSRDVLIENEIENRNFGMTGSPLVIDDRVVVAPGGEGTSLISYQRDNGEPVWSAGSETASYSSPHYGQICGVAAVLCLNGDGLSCHRWSDGEPMFHVPWTSNAAEKNNVCQPIVLSDPQAELSKVFISSGYGRGSAVFEISNRDGEFEVKDVWRSKRLKSKFASAVVKGKFVYGLDNGILTCLGLEDGRRQWKQGRYGHGQLILAGEDLIVLSERGYLAQVKCDPDQFVESGRVPALSVQGGRTWNHPSFDGQYLLVRNSQQAMCYEIEAWHNPQPVSAEVTDDGESGGAMESSK